MLIFLRKNQTLLSSFVSVLLSLYIVFAASTGRLRTDPIGPLLLWLMRPIQNGSQAAILKLRGMQQKLTALKRLIAEDEELRRKIEELEAERNRLLEAEATNQRLREILDLQRDLPVRSIAASVIGNSASSWFRSLTIDRGSEDGVRKGMAVVSRRGVVGQVVSLAPRSAKVLVVTDHYSGVDVIDQRSRARGIVSGSLGDGAVMKYVKRGEDVQKGDRLVTSGLDGVFPKGLMVGTVAKVDKKRYGLFQQVVVSLAVDPSRVEEVLVVSADKEPPGR